MKAMVIGEELRSRCPDVRYGVVEGRVENGPADEGLWQEIDEVAAEIAATVALPEVKIDPAIAATRVAYKACGKEPNRYRPSAEALRRRVIRGLGLGRVNRVVDVINLVSLRTGFSIGGFDADRIEGDDLAWGIGRSGEPYAAIGRGPLNIEGLPVLRDRVGPIGTPTSDHERTRLTGETTRALVVINAYGGDEGLADALDLAVARLERHAHGGEMEVAVID